MNLSLRAEMTKVPGSLWGPCAGAEVQSKAALCGSEQLEWPFSYSGVLTTDNFVSGSAIRCAGTETFLE